MNRVHSIIFIVLSTTVTSFPTFLLSQGLSTHRLVIAIDEQESTGENSSNAITNEVNALIIQKSAPILFPLAIWDRFIIGRNIVEDAKKLDQTSLEQKYAQLQTLLASDFKIGLEALILTIDTLEAYKKGKKKRGKELSTKLKEVLETSTDETKLKFFISTSIVASRITFNASDWHGTIFNERFLLLVPQSYAQKMQGNFGLKIEKKSLSSELLDISATLNRFETFIQTVPSKESLGKVFLTTLDFIFDTEKSDINMDTPRWAIYLTGHGMGKLEFVNWSTNEDALKAKELQDTINYYGYILAANTQDLEVEQEDYKKLGKIKALFSKKGHADFIKELEEDIRIAKEKISESKKAFDELIEKQRYSNLFADKETTVKSEITIASLTLDEFKNLLTFLSKKISTAVFAYTSCYASGSNIAQIYNQDQKTLFTDKHPFVIASAGITETTVGISSITDFVHYPPDETEEDLKSYKNPSVKNNINFDSFFTMLEKDNPIAWEKALDLIFFFTQYPENTPLIKFPGTEWFTIPDVKEKVLSISNIMATTRDQDKELIIKNQDLILLYAYKIPFTLKYFKKELKEYSLIKPPFIISMLPGDSYHEFESIHAPTYKASSILESFLNFRDIQSKKIFSIHAIEAINDILPNSSEKTIHLKDVYIFQNASSQIAKDIFGFTTETFRNNNIICFTANGKPYGWLWPSERAIILTEEAQVSGVFYRGFYRGILDTYKDTIKSYIDLLKEQKLVSTQLHEDSFSQEKKEKLIKVLEKKAQALQEKSKVKSPTTPQKIKPIAIIEGN